MMRSIIRYCFICAFLCKGFAGRTESPVNTAYADSLFTTGNYSFAALEYERAYFISDNPDGKNFALLKKSYCYKKLSQYDKAISTLNRIFLSSFSDSLQFTVRYELALNSFLAGNYYDAEGLLYDIRMSASDSVSKEKCRYLEILTENELQHWDKADSLFLKYLSVNSITIDSASLKGMMKRPKLHNPKTAMRISYFIPGSGQMMSGHIFRGLSSIIFTGGAAAYTTLSIINKFYVSAFTSGLSILQLFYFGGVRYAYILAEKRNAERIYMHNKTIRDFILAYESIRK